MPKACGCPRAWANTRGHQSCQFPHVVICHTCLLAGTEPWKSMNLIPPISPSTYPPPLSTPSVSLLPFSPCPPTPLCQMFCVFHRLHVLPHLIVLHTPSSSSLSPSLCRCIISSSCIQNLASFHGSRLHRGNL